MLALTVAAAAGLAAPAAAGGVTPHVEHPSQARCMGEAVSYGAVTFGPRAVALHQRAAMEGAKADGESLGTLTRAVAALPSCG